MVCCVRFYFFYVFFCLDVDFDFDLYFFNVFVVCELENIIFYLNVMFFVGENGFGKLMVLEVIVVVFGFGLEGGMKNV